jgi:hypothetical protein
MHRGAQQSAEAGADSVYIIDPQPRRPHNCAARSQRLHTLHPNPSHTLPGSAPQKHSALNNGCCQAARREKP